jgi:3-oxoadipate enol-lactonase
LPVITVPTLVVVGTEDAATPVVHARRIAEGIDGARLELINAVGHSSVLEQPDTVSRLLNDFVTSAANT